MGKAPDDIRREIEETRSRMGETVEAIGYRADVPGRAKESVSNMKENVVGSVRDAKDRVVETIVGSKESVQDSMSSAGESISGGVSNAGQSISGTGSAIAGRISDATPSSDDIRAGARRTVGIAQENPLGLAVGAAAVGFLAGMMIPATKIEREKVGPIADQVRDKAMETGQEALDRGKQVAGEAADAARRVVDEARTSAQEAAQQGVEDIKSSVQQQGQDLASTAQENAQDIAGSQSGVGGQAPSSPPYSPPPAPPAQTGPPITGDSPIIGGTVGPAISGTTTEEFPRH